jgi:hypothetical protein
MIQRALDRACRRLGPRYPKRAVVLQVQLDQRLLDPLAVGVEADQLLREPLDYLEAEGFEVERLQRSKWGIVEHLVARKAERRP